jgi:hypothetical protein
MIGKVEQEKERELGIEIQEVHCTYVGILIGKVEQEKESKLEMELRKFAI